MAIVTSQIDQDLAQDAARLWALLSDAERQESANWLGRAKQAACKGSEFYARMFGRRLAQAVAPALQRAGMQYNLFGRRIGGSLSNNRPAKRAAFSFVRQGRGRLAK